MGIKERAVLALLSQLFESSKDQTFSLNSVSAAPPLPKVFIANQHSWHASSFRFVLF